MPVNPAVVTLALHPFRELPTAPGTERFERDGALVMFHPHPNAQIVEPVGLDAAAVPSAVAAAREAARERGKQLLAWWIAPQDAGLGPALEQEGLVNEDTPGFEAVETAMVLVQPPTGESHPEITVGTVESFEEFLATMAVVGDAFDFPEAMRAEIESEAHERWEEYKLPENPGRQYLARIGDEIVGTAGTAFGDAGINLFGGAVLPHARGRGVYRELTLARWEDAVSRGTPALTVQAGKMSLPILRRLGFVSVGEARLYVDHVEAATSNS